VRDPGKYDAVNVGKNRVESLALFRRVSRQLSANFSGLYA
jgi:hypothetical protein